MEESRKLEVLVESLLASGHVPEERRVEATAELVDHLQQGIRRHLVLGRNETEALVRAVRDLGNPGAIRRALSRGWLGRDLARALRAWSSQGLLESVAGAVGKGRRGVTGTEEGGGENA